MTEPSPTPGLWNETNWFHARARTVDVVLIILTLTSAAAYVLGIVLMEQRNVDVGLVLCGSALALFLLTSVLFRVSHPYRRVPDADLRIIFHMTSAQWSVGETLVLDVGRCRRRQILAEGHRRRAGHLVYFFPERPTLKHALAIATAGGRRVVRYLYELEVLTPIIGTYRRGAAMGTTSSITVRVLTHQTAGAPGFNNRRLRKPRRVGVRS